MDFGRLPHLNGVDFTLPPDHPATASRLAALPATTAGKQVFAGPPVWTNREWQGKWYPAGASEKDFLKHYAQQFNAIELNTTHYRIPDARTVQRWREAVPASFRFCPKIPQIISHEKALVGTAALTAEFCESLRSLGSNLGPLFLQLPPGFGPEGLPRLRRYLKEFPADFALAVEMRHPDFFTDAAASEAAFALLEEYGASAVLTDVAGRRDVLHQRLTAPFAFVRFVGNGLHPTDYRRLGDWTDRLTQWLASGLQDVYFFLHQPDNRLSPETTAYFIEQLNLKADLQVPPPKALPQMIQGSLF